MEDKLRKDVEAMVMSIFSEKEEAEVRRKTENALQQAAATIEDLTNTLEERNSEIEGLKSSSKEMEGSIKDLNTELEAAKEEINTSNEKLGETQSALEEIKKDRLAEVRFNELEEAKVARIDEKYKSDQVSKIREMSNEDFVAYKDELVAIRAAVIAEIEANETPDTNNVDANTDFGTNTGVDTDDVDTSNKNASEDSNADVDTDAEEDTPLANIDPDKSISAAMNLDVFPGDDILSKYSKLGQAMAERFKNKN